MVVRMEKIFHRETEGSERFFSYIEGVVERFLFISNKAGVVSK
jgi:hypothetical protein